VFDCHTLHLELTAGVSGVARVHGLWVEGINLKEVTSQELLKSVLILPLFSVSSTFILH